ncbi:MAG: DUF294 nucleotidyltransferase-like domain-containing protein [Armatimonadota bacterium]
MATTRVDLHCHTVHSDGTLTPRELADALAGDHVVVAALTDHDSVDGLTEFNQALTRREVSFISGVEITTQYEGTEVHLLAYGFDPSHTELLTVLRSIRQTRTTELHSIADTLRLKGSPASDDVTAAAASSNGRIEVSEAIAIVHRAGGRAFLAHPLILQPDIIELENLLLKLIPMGLDGIEAIYFAFTDTQRQALCKLADRFKLLVSAGTDAHDRKQHPEPLGMEMPTELWKAFRDAVCHGNPASQPHIPSAIHKRHTKRLNWREFGFHFVFPSLLAIILFITAIYAVFLPTFERSLLDRKREMIRELTNSAASILKGYQRDEAAGKMTRAQAQEMAKSRIGLLRYGHEGKDYFWLQDMQPRMIMHPYRRDLIGKDVSNFRDPQGRRIFVEFAELVRRGREGYVEYVWQWKDDPSRLVPKESYIMGFQPWGWIIGTGIYVEDVKHEIKQIELSLVRTALGISIIIVLLMLYVIRQSLALERERAEAEKGLVESTERYRSLVEATTEGTLLVTEGRCRYANPIFLQMIGFTQQELELLDLADIFPAKSQIEPTWQYLHQLLRGEEVLDGFDAVLQRRDGKQIECFISTSQISAADRSGFILLVRDVSPARDDTHEGRQWRYLQQVVDNIPIGIFRARPSSRGTLLEYSHTAGKLLGISASSDDLSVTLADIFGDTRAYDAFFSEMSQKGSAAYTLHITDKDLVTRSLLIAAILERNEQGQPRFIDGIIEDTTQADRHAGQLNETIVELQTSLLFLHEPVGQVKRSAVYCRVDAPIRSVAAIMTDQHASAALIQSDTDHVLGIVTDSDFRERVVGTKLTADQQIHTIMSAPLISVPEKAPVYEALLLMERKSIQHLAVSDDAGRIIGIIYNQELLQFRNYGPAILSREIQQAASPEAVAQQCMRLPELAKALLDSGAHPCHITQMITSVCDSATVSLIELAQQKLGKAPVPFVFLALGSHGRQEMTLASDQDNAIIYEAPADAEVRAQAESYLQELSNYVCNWLAEAGYPLCHGNVMARNPRWCQPLSVWKQYFTDWISLPEPQQLLEFTIFFDFRPIYGTTELAQQLRRHVHQMISTQPSFYPHFAQNSLLFKPPTRLFGRIGGEHQKPPDLKEALIPLVSYARLYALKAGLDDTNTTSRIQALMRSNAIQESSGQDIISAFEFLMKLRMQHQTTMVASGQLADNAINLRRLGLADQTMLSQSFTAITAIQKRISYDFLGGSV